MTDLNAIQELTRFFTALKSHKRDIRRLLIVLLKKHFNNFRNELMTEVAAIEAADAHHEEDERTLGAETSAFAVHWDALLSDPYARIEDDLGHLQRVIDLLKIEERNIINAMLMREIMDRPMAFRDEDEDFF